MKLKPLGKRVVVEFVEKEVVTKSGIVLPDTAKEEPQFAVVVEIGEKILKNDAKREELEVGDKVIISKYAGTEVKLDDKKYTVIKFDDILAVVK